MRGIAMMTQETTAKYDNLKEEYQSIVTDFIDFLSSRQSNEERTLKVIKDADSGVDLSEPFDNVNDLMVALNA